MVVDEVLTVGKETGEFKEDLDVRLARQMVFGTIDETITTWVMNDQKYDLTAIAPRVHDLLIKGFGATP
jgi:TetR/AcrR family fatty acid metabolism transcriptional regulator